ncbi:T9SS type A sorting domain-containing protein [Rasiella rasia]|uniref:T9SS type A sorting domain-containing protein n=1 Tax=Rasiella rasia TaxID=2744027 RepID=A0A6G6GP70_9FLAO|nr:T9SS type A sorting domain-containing protein [Rasiella rasia]QIE60376.1 T9SS type A sorting domain-containing protein [Rasiella rasia]
MKKITLLFAAALATVSMNAQATLFSDNFEAETVDAVTFSFWDSVDVDGDGEFWEVADIAAFAAVDAPNHPMMSLAADSDSWEGVAFSPDNFLISQPINITGATGLQIDYVVGSYQTSGAFIADKYDVLLVDSNDPIDIVAATPLYTATVGDDATCASGDGADSAAPVTVDASALDGSTGDYYLVFRHYDTVDENSVLIDDVFLTAASLSVEDQAFANFNYFVNNGELNLSAANTMESLTLYNVIGQQVVNQKLSGTNEVINISSLSAGIYVAQVTIDGTAKTFKIAKK